MGVSEIGYLICLVDRGVFDNGNSLFMTLINLKTLLPLHSQ